MDEPKLFENETKIERKKRVIQDNKRELYNKLSKIRTQMLASKTAAFLASDVFKTDIGFTHELVEMGAETMATDGFKIMIDPDFFRRNNLEENLWGLSHETLHILFGHINLGKLTGKDPQLFNIAADGVINATLRVCNIGQEPPNVISSDYSGNVTFKLNDKEIRVNECHKKNVLDVYDELLKHCQENPPPKGSGGEGNGSGKDDSKTFDNHNHKKLTPEEVDEQRQKMSDKAAEGKLRGNMPGWLADKLGKMLEGKINWKDELLEEMIPLIKSLPTFRKPRRRNPNPDIFLPGNVREGIKLSVGIDTSGSIGERERAYFLGEIASIYEQFPVGSVEMTVYFHHTECYHKIEMSGMEELKGYQFQSGGTDHHDIMEKMVEDGTNYAVFLTDGYSSFPSMKEIPNILWIVTEKDGMEQIPEGFGKKIHVKISELKEVN